MEGIIAILMLVFGMSYFFWKDGGSRRPLIFKALATMMAALLAFSYTMSQGNAQAWWTTVGILCYMVADVLLEIRFPAGVICFGGGHICLITGILWDHKITWHAGVFFVILYAGMFWAMRLYLHKLKQLLIPAIVYAAILCAMASMAILTGVQTGGIKGVLPGLGGICFVVSDTIIGWSHLSGKYNRIYSAVLLFLYFLAVYLLAVGLTAL